jgi:hypothetical protein
VAPALAMSTAKAPATVTMPACKSCLRLYFIDV